MRLFIAEKPSMGAEIARCLPGPVSRKDGHIETGGGIVTWGYGHILRQAEPEEYDPRYKKWIAEDLPIVPDTWKLCVTESSSKQFAIVENLISKASEIVHAGDPDREGQLLIDEVLEYTGNSKPVLRILLNALDEKSIKKALNSLRNNQDFIGLKNSALARSRADWVVGMNLSRAYSIAAQKAGHRITFPIGRVKTPTLALVVRREREIQDFKPVDYFVLKLAFMHDNGVFSATWEPKDTQRGLDPDGRLVEVATVDYLAGKFKASADQLANIVSCETTEKKEAQRLPFSLSALQVEAGKRFGYDPQTVLDTAQKLYEKKLTSYPRSDCDYLPENQMDDIQSVLSNLQNISCVDLANWAGNADGSIKSRAWNDAKISAHHAIIPTTVKCDFSALSEVEQNIYFLIAQAYIAQFYQVHIFNQTKVIVSYSDENFKANGRMVIEPGWKELYRKEKNDSDSEDEEDGTLPEMQSGDTAKYMSIAAMKKTTRPPERFTASTLLAAMKEIHKYVKNQELKKQLKDVSGIGTEATRATIIKELITKVFLEEKKKRLYPTDAAYLLIDSLPDDITYPDTTAIWETLLNSMVDGATDLDNFMSKQVNLVTALCEKASGLNLMAKPLQGECVCPQCGQGVLGKRKGPHGEFWGCSCYPDCRATFPDKSGKPNLDAPIICPECGKGTLRQRSGKNGKFWSCSNYEECKATFDDKRGKPLIIKCPACGTGTLHKRKGNKGDFWYCSKNSAGCKATFNDEKGKPQLKKEQKIKS